MSKLFVYVAGPYSKPDPVANTAAAIHFGNELLDFGYRPFIPHLSMYQHQFMPRPWKEWMEIDLDWVTRCDCLIRLPGVSKGADKEVEHARRNKIPFIVMDDMTDDEQQRVFNWLESKEAWGER